METKYGSIAQWAKARLKSGEFAAGDKFFSESEICRQHTASRQTVRQALDMLEREGLLERRRGSGTYVRQLVPSPKAGRNIGVISTYFSDYIFPGIITGIEKHLSQCGYGMQLAITNNQVDNEEQALRRMLARQVSALIIEPTKSALPNPNPELYREIQSTGLPVVFFNAGYAWANFPVIALDDVEAGRLATQTLLDAGHRQIAGIFKSDDFQGHLRYQGYMQCMNKAGLQVESRHVVWYATEEKPSLFSYPRRILDPLENCTGAVCYNDEIAVHLMDFCGQQKLPVPEALSVVGVDNASISALCHPPLTTVMHPKEALGEAVAKAALTLLEDSEAQVGRLFQPKLVMRQSVARCKKA